MSVATRMLFTLRQAGLTLLAAISVFMSEAEAPEEAPPTPRNAPRAGKTPGLLGFEKGERPPERERRIEIHARTFEFEPDVVGVPLGVPIRFIVVSEDMYHTYTIKRVREAPDILLNIEVPAGATAEGVYTFQDPGEYYVYCIPHEKLGMIGAIRASDVGGPSEP